MKKILKYILIIIIILILGVGILSAFKGGNSREHFTMELAPDNKYILHWDDKTYTSFGTAYIDGEGIWGDEFGVIDGGTQYADFYIFLVNGQVPEEWVVVGSSRDMGDYVLCKESAVTIIPDDFKQLSWE